MAATAPPAAARAPSLPAKFSPSTVRVSAPLVPMASPWKPGAVAWGIAAFYVLVLIQLTSWGMKWLPRKVWHGIHMLSYPMFVLATYHGVVAGNADRSNIVFVLVAAGGCSILLFAATARVLQARHKRIQKSLV